MSGRKLLLILSLAVATGCSKPPRAWVRVAPTSQAETGVLVRADKSAIDRVLSLPGVSARALHEGSDFYEIYGLSEFASEILARSRAFFLGDNVYFDSIIPDEERPRTNPAQAEIDALMKSCKQNAEPPFAEIVIENPDILQNALLPVDKGLIFNAGKSQAANSGEEITKHWIINAPFFSNVAANAVIRDQIKLNPDSVGRYSVTLVVKNAKGACATTTKSIGTTFQPPFVSNQRRRPFRPGSEFAFPHLEIIRALPAWEKAQGEGQLVAILDTGVDYNNPALGPNIEINPSDIPDNGLDDDGNGAIDDVVGWDFINNDNLPFDDDGHGTHVAGLSSSTTMGVAPKSRILPVKVINGVGGGDVGTIAAGILYAVDRGANIINLSFGSVDKSFEALQYAITYAEDRGVIVVAAAGNGDVDTGTGLNLDISKVLPASFKNSNLIAVAASHKGRLARYSNFGQESVFISAPGGEGLWGLRSTAPWNKHGIFYYERSGTSMAAPLVSGAIALLLEINPSLSNAEIRDRLASSGHVYPRLNGLLKTPAVLDAAALVQSKAH